MTVGTETALRARRWEPVAAREGAVSRRRAYRQMTLAGVLWGTIGPAAAIVDQRTSLSPLQTSLWRLVIAVVPLVLLAVFAGRATARPNRSALLFGVAVGAVTGASQLAYFAAVASTGIAVATLIANGLGPILTAVGETVVFRVRPDRRTLVALPVALTGLALLVLDGPGEVTIAGVLFAIVAAITYATATLAAGPASRRMDITVLNAVAVVGGALTLLPFVLVTGGVGAPDSVAGWLAVLHLGLVVSGLAYGLYFSAARSLPSTHITILTLLEPLTATVIAAAVFGEALTVGALVGGLLMLGAVVGLRAREDPKAPPPAPA